MEFDGESHKRLSDRSNRSIREYETGIHQIDPLKMTPLYHVKKAKHALSTLKTVANESDWNKMFEHSSGVVVYMKQDTLADEDTPLIKGELNIQGFTPDEIFSVVKDLSMVENFERSKSGTIYYASTSVETLKAPSFGVGNRENLKLSGWILKSISDSPRCTKILYVIQMKGWVPVNMFKVHLSKRPLVINTVKEFLQNRHKNPGFTPPPRSSSLQHSKQASNFNDNNVPDNNVPEKNRHGRHSFLGYIKEDEDDSEQTIPDFPIPPERNITSELSSKKPIIISKPESQDPSKLIKKPVTSHDYYNNAKKALELLKFLVNNWDGWDLYAESKGVKIYQKDSGKLMPYLRGDVTIYGGFYPTDILSYINNLDSRKLYGSIIERYSFDYALTRVAMKGTFPLSGRDFIAISITERDPATGTIWVANTSIVDPRAPESKNYVRANLVIAGWVLRPNFDGEKIVSVDVKYIVDIDLKINSVPQSILKMLSMQVPLRIANIDDSLQKIGFPPYILSASGLIKNVEFNIKTFQYDVTISIDGGTIVELRISKKMYPDGFDISAQPENAKAELLNDGEVVRITVQDGTETLHIKVQKNTKGTQNTFRSKKFVTLEEIDPSLTSCLKKPKNHKKDDTNKSAATRTNDESVASNNKFKNQTNIVIKLSKDQNKSRQNKEDEVIPIRTEHKLYKFHIPPPSKSYPTSLRFSTQEIA
ncbi:2685_t:CDS:2, partial [Racocetra fulgida]